MTGQSFEEHVLALTQTLYRVSASILPQYCDREDAVQSCIMKAWNNLGKVRSEDTFRPWIVRILINECYTILRKQKRWILAEEVTTKNQATAYENRDEGLHDAIQALPEKQRIVILLHYVEDIPVAEIAQILEIPAGTVKSRLHMARQTLQKTLQEVNIHEKFA